jgi:RNA polymerase sigma factor (sigma-70 family)
MDDDKLARRFEASRPRLRAMAYRMLGSLGDADDAVQEGWLRAAGADSDDVANMEGWFTTIVARVCLDMLRSRKSRREEPLDPDDAVAAGFEPGYEQGPEQETMLADSVGLAMLVVLDNLAPAERVAFVLHDTFGLPFGEIAAGRARYGRVALINGTPGLIVAPRGRLVLALVFTYSGDTISQIDVIADPDRLAALDLAVVEP